MKKFFLFLGLLAGAAAVVAADEAIMKFVPEQAQGVLVINVKALWTSPLMKEFRTLNQEADLRLTQVESELNRYQTSLPDLFGKVAVFMTGKESGGLVVETAVSETAFNVMLDKQFGQTLNASLNIAKSTQGSRTVYAINPSGNHELIQKVQQAGLLMTYLDPTHVLFLESKDLAGVLAQLTQSNLTRSAAWQKRLQTINTQATLWCCFDLSDELKKADPTGGNPAMAMLSAVKAVDFSLDLTGKDQSIVFAGCLTCNEAPAAATLAQQMQMVTAIGLNSAFAADPQLAANLTGAMKIAAADKQIKLNLTLTEKLCRQMKEFAAKQTGDTAAPAAEAATAAPPTVDNGTPDPLLPDPHAARRMIHPPDDNTPSQDPPRNVQID